MAQQFIGAEFSIASLKGTVPATEGAPDCRLLPTLTEPLVLCVALAMTSVNSKLLSVVTRSLFYLS